MCFFHLSHRLSVPSDVCSSYWCQWAINTHLRTYSDLFTFSSNICSHSYFVYIALHCNAESACPEITIRSCSAWSSAQRKQLGSSLLAFHRNPASQHRQTHFAEVSFPNKAEGERHQPADKKLCKESEDSSYRWADSHRWFPKWVDWELEGRKPTTHWVMSSNTFLCSEAHECTFFHFKLISGENFHSKNQRQPLELPEEHFTGLTNQFNSHPVACTKWWDCNEEFLGTEGLCKQRQLAYHFFPQCCSYRPQ